MRLHRQTTARGKGGWKACCPVVLILQQQPWLRLFLEKCFLSRGLKDLEKKGQELQLPRDITVDFIFIFSNKNLCKEKNVSMNFSKLYRFGLFPVEFFSFTHLP